MALSSCANENISYEAQEISIRENNKSKSKSGELSIDGIYETTEDTPIYDSPNELDPFDVIQKGSSVRVLEEEDQAFIRVDYFGSQGYVKASSLKEV